MEMLPVAVRPDVEPDNRGQFPLRAMAPPVTSAPIPFWRPDDSWRSTMLPYQRRFDTGRLSAPMPGSMSPTPSGPVATRGAGIGKPSRLASVPVYQYGPDGTLVRRGRVAANNPGQWSTTSALPNGLVYEHAEAIRWPST